MEREFSRVILDALPGLVWTARPDGHADFFNQRWLDYSGLTEEEAMGLGWQEVVHPEDLPQLLEYWSSRLVSSAAGQAEARVRRFDGVYRWFQFRTNPMTNASGQVIRWCGINTDIEDQKRAEQELLRSEAFLAHGEVVSETGSFLWRPETGEIRWSNQLYRIFEFELGTPVTTERIAGRIHPEDLWVSEDMVNRAQAGRGLRYEYRLLMSDGGIKHLHFVGRATLDQEGSFEYIGTIQNVTERRLAEQALSKVRSELAHVARVTSLNALTASIAHEVNQPLSGIVTNASTCLRMLAARRPNIEGARETARRTIRDGNRASEIISRLRALFANKNAAIEPLDLNDAAREVIALSVHELQISGVVLRQDFADDLPAVPGDRTQLQQVILNLILNAADAMNEVTDRPRSLVVRTQRHKDDQVRLDVQDCGIGIDSKIAGKLFEAFFTTKSKGMGIGLSVSRSIVESHGGRLWAMANDGPGATFSFAIPFGDEARSWPIAPGAPVGETHAGGRSR
jgi:PAS domain S-box-containing protein